MSTALKLDSMTLEEKLAAMDLLWADLSARAEGFQSPQWHTTVLDSRLQQTLTGATKFLDWKTAIAQLKEELHANQAAGERES